MPVNLCNDCVCGDCKCEDECNGRCRNKCDPTFMQELESTYDNDKDVPQTDYTAEEQDFFNH